MKKHKFKIQDSFDNDDSLIFSIFNFKRTKVYFGFAENWNEIESLYIKPLKENIFPIFSIQEDFNIDPENWQYNNIYVFDKSIKLLIWKNNLFLEYLKNITVTLFDIHSNIMKGINEENIIIINYPALINKNNLLSEKDFTIPTDDNYKLVFTEDIFYSKNITLTYNKNKKDLSLF